MTSELPGALTATWVSVGIDPAQLDHLSIRATMRRSVAALPVANGAPAISETVPVTDHDAEISIGAVLGEGGMGVVHAATQRSLRREVAVKRLRAGGEREGQEAERLLREARVTGRLEHPNVVPIHLLGRDDAGQPLIVMKRVEGRPWSELLAEASPAERGTEPYLRRHLDVLIQVSRALSFAHRERVLHRDIKPDNVMVGVYGEVYLVDWGIAVGLPPVPEGLPAASEVQNLEGTPVYLAPEMAAGDGGELDERTDVYLLGATLYEVLTGAPPHAANDARAAVVKAFLAEPPTFAAAIPSELAAIARRALSRDRNARQPSAEAFGEELVSFLVHRGSSQLRDAAVSRAAELDSLTRSTQGPIPPQAYALFHEARFAFEQALSSWSDNAEARAGRRQLLISMIELQLSRGTPSGAGAILPSLDDAPAELRARVEAAVSAERAHLEELKQLAHDANMAVGAKSRQALTYLAAVTWAASCIAAGLLTRAGVLVFDHALFALMNLGFFVGTGIAMVVTRKETLANAVNRRVAYTTMLVFGAGVVLWPMFGALGLSMPQCTMLGAFISALLWTTATFTLGLPWLPMVLGQLGVTVAVWLVPEYHFEIFGAVGGLQTAIAARLMTTHGPQPVR